MAEKDEAIGYLLQEAQQVLGKPLNPVATDTVVSLYSYYGMEPDLILMLIQYCVSKGKSSMRYVEKVASTWLEKGIDTHERAEKEILRVSQQDRAESEIRRTFGIYDRSLVPSEKKYIDTWFNEYHMEIPLIQLAYERTVEVKGKLSFAYINGILANWRQKNIKTPAQAMQEMKRTREGPNRGKPTEASYDMAELEKMIAQGDWLK